MVPKPVLPEDLTLATRAGKAAGMLIDAKTDEVLAFVKQGLAGDIDGIHDLRIAVKRLREAMRLCRRLFPKRRYARLMPLVDRLNDALGQVRDLDVLVQNAAALGEQAPEAGGILEVVCGVWSERRSQVEGDMVALWDQLLGKGKLVQGLRRLARKTRKRRSRLDRIPFERYGYMAILAANERVQRRIGPALKGDDPTALHSLRIAVKRLKYTMEPFTSLYPPLQAVYDQVADLQTALGGAHDVDVLGGALTDYLTERELMGTAASSALLSAVNSKRAQLYAAAQDKARALQGSEWVHRLMDVLD